MPRDVDEKKTRKALRKLRKAKARAEAEGIDLSDWEAEFVEGVEERLETYGSAFADPNLGQSDAALSNAQTEILRQLERKSRGKTGGGFKTRKPLKPRKGFQKTGYKTRDLAEERDELSSENNTEDIEPNVPYTENLPKLRAVEKSDSQTDDTGKNTKPLPKGRPVFKVIDGGKAE